MINFFNYKFQVVFIYCLVLREIYAEQFVDSERTWSRAWFPHDPSEVVDGNELVQTNAVPTDQQGRPQMGELNACDDTKTNITIDWNYEKEYYMCTGPIIEPRSDIYPSEKIYSIPHGYSAPHICMSESITYEEHLTTFGPHRPNWPKWGEYIYVPKQRYLHSLEHGAVVMLYHPCTNRNEVFKLKSLVRDCLYRHIITPSLDVTEQRPLALLTWGHVLEMSLVDPEVVTEFIRRNAKHGAERTSKDGKYDTGLLVHARIVTDVDDSVLCQ